MHLWTRKSPSNFRSYPIAEAGYRLWTWTGFIVVESWIQTVDTDWIHCGGSLYCCGNCSSRYHRLCDVWCVLRQGYVAEIMLTLEAAVDNLDVNLFPLVKDVFMSTPNLAKDPTPSSSPVIVPPVTTSSPVIVPPATSSSSVAVSSVRVIVGGRGNAILSSASSSPYTHIRSTSYNLAALSRKAIVSSPPILENKGMLRHSLTVCIISISFQTIKYV